MPVDLHFAYMGALSSPSIKGLFMNDVTFQGGIETTLPMSPCVICSRYSAFKVVLGPPPHVIFCHLLEIHTTNTIFDDVIYERPLSFHSAKEPSWLIWLQNIG